MKPFTTAFSFLLAAAMSLFLAFAAEAQSPPAQSTDFVESSHVFPTTDVIDRFDLFFDSDPAVSSTPVAVTGGNKLRHPLAALSVGAHTLYATACNSSGCGSPSPTLSFIIGPGIVNFTGTLIITP